jgi:hypothetical protein
LVAAIVVTAADRQLDASDVIAAARGSLAGYKLPRLVVFAAEVPRAPNGKIDYAAVRAVLADGQCQPPRPPGSLGENARLARQAGDQAGDQYWSGLAAGRRPRSSARNP